MDLSLKTKRGGVISIHFGKIVTTNLWDDYGWYQITMPEVIEKLNAIRHAKRFGELERESTLVGELLTAYPNPNSIGMPYRREVKTSSFEAYSESAGPGAP